MNYRKSISEKGIIFALLTTICAKKEQIIIKSTEIESFLLLFDFFCYLCNDFPHSLLDECHFKWLSENITAHAVLREAKSSDGVDEAGSIGKAARRFRQRWEAGNGIEPMNER